MRSALQALQFVEKDQPITVDIQTKRVTFTVTNGKAFDPEKTKEALKRAGFPDARVLAAPA